MKGTTGVAQVHVVERWPGERHGHGGHALRIERGEHGRDRRAAVLGTGTDHAAVELDLAEPRDAAQRGARPGVAGVCELDLDGVALKLVLELVGRSARDDLAAV